MDYRRGDPYEQQEGFGLGTDAGRALPRDGLGSASPPYAFGHDDPYGHGGVGRGGENYGQDGDWDPSPSRGGFGGGGVGAYGQDDPYGGGDGWKAEVTDKNDQPGGSRSISRVISRMPERGQGGGGGRGYNEEPNSARALSRVISVVPERGLRDGRDRDEFRLGEEPRPLPPTRGQTGGLYGDDRAAPPPPQGFSPDRGPPVPRAPSVNYGLDEGTHAAPRGAGKGGGLFSEDRGSWSPDLACPPIRGSGEGLDMAGGAGSGPGRGPGEGLGLGRDTSPPDRLPMGGGRVAEGEGRGAEEEEYGNSVSLDKHGLGGGERKREQSEARGQGGGGRGSGGGGYGLGDEPRSGSGGLKGAAGSGAKAGNYGLKVEEPPNTAVLPRPSGEHLVLWQANCLVLK